MQDSLSVADYIKCICLAMVIQDSKLPLYLLYNSEDNNKNQKHDLHTLINSYLMFQVLFLIQFNYLGN